MAPKRTNEKKTINTQAAAALAVKRLLPREEEEEEETEEERGGEGREGAIEPLASLAAGAPPC